MNLASLKEKYNVKIIVDPQEIVDLPDVCEACWIGKQHRQSFPKEASITRAPLELVHMDLCGRWRQKHWVVPSISW